MNPFAQFAYGAKLLSVSSGEEVDSVLGSKTEASSSSNVEKKMKKRKISDVGVKASNKSSPEIMSAWWKELRELTSNYPFAVMLTAVLGAQTRDVVTVGVMQGLAASLGGDICPTAICAYDFDELEGYIKRLNYCHKKTRTMMDLASMFHAEPVPSTTHGLKTVPGVGPVITEIILRVAFGEKDDEHEGFSRLQSKKVCGVSSSNSDSGEVVLHAKKEGQNS